MLLFIGQDVVVQLREQLLLVLLCLFLEGFEGGQGLSLGYVLDEGGGLQLLCGQVAKGGIPHPD